MFLSNKKSHATLGTTASLYIKLSITLKVYNFENIPRNWESKLMLVQRDRAFTLKLVDFLNKIDFCLSLTERRKKALELKTGLYGRRAIS